MGQGKPKGEAGKVSKGGLNVKAPKDLKPKFKSKVAAAADAAGAAARLDDHAVAAGAQGEDRTSADDPGGPRRRGEEGRP